MGCGQVCDCECTIVTVDPNGTPTDIWCASGGLTSDGCRCALSGDDGANISVDMWYVNDLIFVQVITATDTYTGICEGTGSTLCVNDRFTCGGIITCHSEGKNDSIEVEINGEACQVYEYLDCPAYSTTDLTQWEYEACTW